MHPAVDPGPRTATTADFLGIDIATQGNWKGVYGSDGFDISQDSSPNNPTLPSYASLSFTGNYDYTWTTATSEPRAPLQAVPNSTARIASGWYSPTNFG